FYCGSKITKKNGKNGGKQLYKCYVCGRQFLDTPRLDAQEIWHLYSSGKQTYAELAAQFGCSTKTVQRKIDSVQIVKNKTFMPRSNVVMDTTYFGRSFGVMAFKDSLSSTMLLLDFVKHETLLLYESGIQEINRRGIEIQSIICDGKKRIFTLFPDIPMQMCQFHNDTDCEQIFDAQTKNRCFQRVENNCLETDRNDKN
ncbi:MAG: hypothetical protein LBN93_02945, partial [Candidatus Symbiothrix sp.]|nr:hypothetical protein [Candidatus Symbiothrix sp.]